MEDERVEMADWTGIRPPESVELEMRAGDCDALGVMEAERSDDWMSEAAMYTARAESSGTGVASGRSTLHRLGRWIRERRRR